MSKPLHILGIAGSLRRHSYNRGVLRAAVELAPPELVIEGFELNDIPVFSQDDEVVLPPKVVELKRRVRAADGIMFVTPEHNYSVPAALKNAIDWASRPWGDNAWFGKPVAIMGASIGNIATARAQYHLRQTCVLLDLYPMHQPEVMIGNAGTRFDDEGNLTDPSTREHIQGLLRSFVVWARRFPQSQA